MSSSSSRGAGPSEPPPKRIVRTQTAGNLGVSIFYSEVVPPSLVGIAPFLRVANEVEKTNPRVAYLCRSYAYEKAHRLDPNSSDRGILQFKTALFERLERENDPTLKGRLKKSDAREMQSFYQHYYKKYIQALQNAADKADRAQLTKAYQTVRVLFDVLKAVSMTQPREVVHKAVTDNILPLDPDSANQTIMRYPEIQAAVYALRNTRGLPWPKDNKKKKDEDILDWLGSMFRFQQQQQSINYLEMKNKELEEKYIMQGRVVFNPNTKPSLMKIYMANMELFEMYAKTEGTGYYDSYRKMDTPWIQEIVASHKNLTSLWENLVAAAEMKPPKEDEAFQHWWLFAGTIYRRMVEPLAIAEYYRKGGKNYMTEKRSKHFVQLEEWLGNQTREVKSNIEAALTAEHNYFWECVQKPLLSCQQSMLVREMEDNLNISSDEESDEPISSLYPSFFARVNQHLLSSKELNFEEANLNGTSENINEDNSFFEARVDTAILSRQGSVVVREKEKNIIGFGARVDKALLSRQGSMVVSQARKNRNTEFILTLDSCFWAHVEEALLSCKELEVVKEKEETLCKLITFQDYVFGLLQNYEVSSEIFLPQSSYMRWWNEYTAIKGAAYNSKLASFMNDPSKRPQYALGAYDFPDSLES